MIALELTTFLDASKTLDEHILACTRGCRGPGGYGTDRDPWAMCPRGEALIDELWIASPEHPREPAS